MPLYYAEEDAGLFSRINNLCRNVEENTDVRISVHSRVLIFNSLTAIVEDPSASWNADANNRQQVYQRFLEELPGRIGDLAKNHSVGGKLSYFDVLHWLSSNLDSICPIEKVVQRSLAR